VGYSALYRTGICYSTRNMGWGKSIL